MNRQLRDEVLRLLNCYYKDLRYRQGSGSVEGINMDSNATPCFESEEELEAYLKGVAYTIGEFIEETRE
jgi:hypothetical protein